MCNFPCRYSNSIKFLFHSSENFLCGYNFQGYSFAIIKECFSYNSPKKIACDAMFNDYSKRVLEMVVQRELVL